MHLLLFDYLTKNKHIKYLFNGILPLFFNVRIMSESKNTSVKVFVIITIVHTVQMKHTPCLTEAKRLPQDFLLVNVHWEMTGHIFYRPVKLWRGL